MTTTINADPLVLTPEISGTGIAGGVVDADPLVLTPAISASFTHWMYISNRDPSLDITFDCFEYDRFGEAGQGVLQCPEMTISGTVLNKNIWAEALAITPTISGTPIVGTVISASPLALTMKISGDPIAAPVKANWVKWSKIGELSFEIDRSNLAGERQMDWTGSIYQVQKLLDKVVVYGVNGVSLLFPYETTFGLQTIYRKGLKSQGAWAGTDDAHFFLDYTGCLCKLTTGLEQLGYESFLGGLINPVLQLDAINGLLYISDASQGFIYSLTSGALGAGFPHVTGFGNQSGTSYIVSPTGFLTPTFELQTGIYDFETRKRKTVRGLEVGTHVTKNLFASIDFRNDHKENFTNIGWYPVTPEGKVFVTCSGVEFRFLLRLASYEKFVLDYFRVEGLIHDFSGGLDSRRNYAD